MSNSESSNPAPRRPSLKSIRPPNRGRRQAVRISKEEMVAIEPLDPRNAIPWVVRPTVEGLHLVSWARDNREKIDRLLLEHRALLFRGFQVDRDEDLEPFIQVTSDGQLLEYKDRSSPRHEVGQKIYTSTDYPADQTIFLHNEGSYWLTWPLKIYFFCHTESETGGATPIADCRKIHQRLPESLRARLREQGVMYVRNFNDGYGLPWQTVFQTDDVADVEAYCRQNDIVLEHRGEGRLRTRQVRQAEATHPTTGEKVWFNHGTFFNVSTLEPSLRESLLADFAEEDLPYNTYYGDGSPIEAEMLETMRQAYHAETVAYPWQRGDVLLLDNMTIAHGRQPFTGQRKVLVGMADPYSPPTRES